MFDVLYANLEEIRKLVRRFAWLAGQQQHPFPLESAEQIMDAFHLVARIFSTYFQFNVKVLEINKVLYTR